MFSKKNKKQYDLKHADGRQHWSLRKTTLGMASVLLSTTIYLGSTNVLVHADTTSDSQTSQATTSSSSSDTSSSSSQTSAQNLVQQQVQALLVNKLILLHLQIVKHPHLLLHQNHLLVQFLLQVLVQVLIQMKMKLILALM